MNPSGQQKVTHLISSSILAIKITTSQLVFVNPFLLGIPSLRKTCAVDGWESWQWLSSSLGVEMFCKKRLEWDFRWVTNKRGGQFEQWVLRCFFFPNAKGMRWDPVLRQLKKDLELWMIGRNYWKKQWTNDMAPAKSLQIDYSTVGLRWELMLKNFDLYLCMFQLKCWDGFNEWVKINYWYSLRWISSNQLLYSFPQKSRETLKAVKIQLTTPVLLRVVLVSMQIWPEGVELGPAGFLSPVLCIRYTKSLLFLQVLL